MSTMAENVIAAGADNRPPMLEKSQYNSWQSRMLLYIQATPTSLASTRPRTIDDLTEVEKIREACDIRATNIVLQGLPLDVYTLVNHHKVTKEIWNKVKLLIQGSKLSLQERESKLYNEFDRFTSEKEETIHSYYLRFAQLINDMNTIRMTMKKLLVNTKQHEVHANEVRMKRQRFLDPLALVLFYHHFFPLMIQLPVLTKQWHSSALHLPHDIHLPTINSGLRPIQGTKPLFKTARNMGNATANQSKVGRCYNYKGEGHMARQCTQPK
ncbi:hypothetical protein Tco_1040488 [Tanacetum coccineum]